VARDQTQVQGELTGKVKELEKKIRNLEGDVNQAQEVRGREGGKGKGREAGREGRGGREGKGKGREGEGGRGRGRGGRKGKGKGREGQTDGRTKEQLTVTVFPCHSGCVFC
jgi:hypothetical protein